MRRRGDVHAFPFDEDDRGDARWRGWNDPAERAEGPTGAPGHDEAGDLDIDAPAPAAGDPGFQPAAPLARRTPARRVLGALLAAAAGALVGMMIAAGVRAVSNAGSPPGSPGGAPAPLVGATRMPARPARRLHLASGTRSRPAAAPPRGAASASTRPGTQLAAASPDTAAGGSAPAAVPATPAPEAASAAGSPEEAEAEFGFER